MSTDDDFDTKIPLREKHNNKASCSGVRAKSAGSKPSKVNCRRKNKKQCSNNHSSAPKSPTSDQWMIPETPSPYHLGRKKRQSGDKGEVIAHSKRTCFGDHFIITRQERTRQKHSIVDVPRNSSATSRQVDLGSKSVSKKGILSSVVKPKGRRKKRENPYAEISDDDIGLHYKSSAAAFDITVPDMETPSSSSVSSSSSNSLGFCLQRRAERVERMERLYDEQLLRPSTSKSAQEDFKPNQPSLGLNSKTTVRPVTADPITESSIVAKLEAAQKFRNIISKSIPKKEPLSSSVNQKSRKKKQVDPYADISDDDLGLHYKSSAAAFAGPDVETPSSSSASCSSSTNPGFCSKKAERLPDDHLARPSTSKSKEDNFKVKQLSPLCKSNALGVSFIDSDSDELATHLNGSSLNCGHKHFSPFQAGKKVTGLRKVLESNDDDDDDDDDEDHLFWQNNYRRGVPLISSDSDDSSDIPVIPKKAFKKRNSSRISSTDSNDGSISSYVAYSPPHTHTSTSSKKSSSERSSDCSHTKNTRAHSHATRQATSESSSSLSSSTSLSSQSNTSSSSTDRSWQYPRPVPPLHSISSLLRVARSGRGLSRYGPHMVADPNNPMDLVFRYPDVHDPEESSSDMEFFTANSYSDNEASMGGMDLTATAPNQENNQTLSLSGSEDEISVIFTTGSSFPESHNRRIRQRGIGGRRRRTRGSGRNGGLSNIPSVVSASPDPVEQVRQMEQDEELARVLQAQFDAEEHHHHEVIDPHRNFSTESDSESVRDSSFARDSSLAEEETVLFPPPRRDLAPTVAMHHGRTTRFGVASNMMFLNNGRRRRGRRNVTIAGGHDPWMFQFARLLGLSPAHTSPEESDYEDDRTLSSFMSRADTLLQFAESIGGDVTTGLRKSEINRLPTRKFYFPGAGPSASFEEMHKHKRTELNKECQVCLADYENGDLLRILPCFHEFHTPCIDPWLKINHTCPVCRVEVVFED